MRLYTFVVLILVSNSGTRCFAQYGSSSVDSIARSLSDIASQMRNQEIDRDTDQTMVGQLVYWRNMATAMNQRLNLVSQNANAAVDGWRKSEQEKARMIKMNKQLEFELAENEHCPKRCVYSSIQRLHRRFGSCMRGEIAR